MYRLLGCISARANAHESLVATSAEGYISLLVWVRRTVCTTDNILLVRGDFTDKPDIIVSVWPESTVL